MRLGFEAIPDVLVEQNPEIKFMIPPAQVALDISLQI